MRIAIIGLGLIGGSIGLALKQANWQKAEVVGYVRRQEIGSLALELGIVDKIGSNLSGAVKGADIVIIATPVLTIKDIFSQIAPDLSTDSHCYRYCQHEDAGYAMGGRIITIEDQLCWWSSHGR